MRLNPTLLLLLACWVAPISAGAQTVPALALTQEQLGTLPQRKVTLTFGNPPAPHEFQGPLLWDVLTASGTVDAARHADVVRQWLRVQARDGYTSVLALGEVSPEFEGKAVILATTMDAALLELPRLVIPGDRRAGRSAREITGLTIDSLPAPQR